MLNMILVPQTNCCRYLDGALCFGLPVTFPWFLVLTLFTDSNGVFFFVFSLFFSSLFSTVCHTPCGGGTTVFFLPFFFIILLFFIFLFRFASFVFVFLFLCSISFLYFI